MGLQSSTPVLQMLHTHIPIHLISQERLTAVMQLREVVTLWKHLVSPKLANIGMIVTGIQCHSLIVLSMIATLSNAWIRN